MGARKKKTTHTLGEKVKHPPSVSVNASAPAWNFSKKDLGGVIFGTTHYTIKECLSNLVFGLPAVHFSYIKNIEPGLPLFLFNYSDRKLHGIYEAASHGQMNINPYGWTEDGSDRTQYPAQVHVRVQTQCQFLKEEQYRKVLRKNYYDQNHFRFELDNRQTAQLLSLFQSSPLIRSSAGFYKSLTVVRPINGVVPNLDTRREVENLKTSAAEEVCPKHCMEAGHPVDLPCSTGKWVSLFKDNSDSDATCESDYIKPLVSEGNWNKENKWVSLLKDNSDSDARREGGDMKPLVSEANWNEENPVCLKGSTIDSRPSGVISCWEEETRPSDATHWEEETRPGGSSCWEEERGPSGITPWKDETRPSQVTPCWEEETRPSGVTPCWDHWEDWEEETRPSGVTPRWDHWEDWEEEVGPSGAVPCWDEGKLIPETQSDKEASEAEQEHIFCKLKQLAFERENLNSKEHREDVFVPYETDKLNSEDEHSPAEPLATNEFQNESSDSSENPFVIDQLRQELEEVKAISMDRNRKIIVLEKKLGDSGILLQQLRDCVMFLESHLQVPSTSGVAVCNELYSNEPLATPVDEPRLGVDELLYIMGGYDGVSWLPTVDCYSPSKDTMRSLKPMTSVRSYASAVELNGLIYNLGGWNGYMWNDTVECYNPSSNEWITCPPLSEKKGCLACASLNNKIFALGGGNGITCFKEVEVFDPAFGRWIPVQSMLHKRFASAAAELDGVLYVVGGYDEQSYLKSAERFDPREASWSKLRSMNTSRGSHVLTVSKGKIYALGGYDGNKYVPSVEVFDPSMGSWLALAGEDMKHSRGYFVAPVIGETIYAIGGQKEGNTIVDSVETYRPGYGWSETKLNGIGKRCFFSAVLR